MKKLVIASAVILCLCGSSEAARVTKPYTFSAGQTIRSADVNSNFDTVYNEFNGSIEGGTSGNIKADSLTEIDMADDINPRVRWDEGFQDFVYTGLQPATAAGLTSDISAGTAYVNGYRANKASATSKTYTNTKDTYVDIDYNGVFHYTEVARLAAAPAVYTDSIRLAAVAAQGGALTQVTDLRVLTPYATGSSKDVITRGFELVWASTTTITVNPGTLYINVTQVDKTTATTLDITAAGDAIDGVTAQQGTNKWVYVYCDDAGNLKLWSIAPNASDTVATTAGTLIYYRYGSEWYRCIGQIRLNATGSGEVIKFYKTGNRVEYDDPVTDAIVVNATNAVAFTNIDCSGYVPPTSNYVLLLCHGNGANIFIRTDGSSGAGQTGNVTYSNMEITTSSSQIIEYKDANAASVYIRGYLENIR